MIEDLAQVKSVTISAEMKDGSQFEKTYEPEELAALIQQIVEKHLLGQAA